MTIERRKITTIDGDFNIPFSLMARTTRQDREVNWGLEQYNKSAESNRHIQNSTQQWQHTYSSLMHMGHFPEWTICLLSDTLSLNRLNT